MPGCRPKLNLIDSSVWFCDLFGLSFTRRRRRRRLGMLTCPKSTTMSHGRGDGAAAAAALQVIDRSQQSLQISFRFCSQFRIPEPASQSVMLTRGTRFLQCIHIPANPPPNTSIFMIPQSLLFITKRGVCENCSHEPNDGHHQSPVAGRGSMS